MPGAPGQPGSAASNSAGAQAAAAQQTAAAAQSAAWSWASLRAQLDSAHASAQAAAARLSAQAQTWRPDWSRGLQAKLEVDVLGPALTTARTQWAGLPEPVRQVLPFAGVAVLTSVATRQLYAEQLALAHSRYGQLRADHDAQLAQLGQLQAQLDDVHARRSGVRLEVEMAEAVAQATNAAAAAATAAATAAAAAAAAAPPGERQPRGRSQPRGKRQQQATRSSRLAEWSDAASSDASNDGLGGQAAAGAPLATASKPRNEHARRSGLLTSLLPRFPGAARGSGG